MRRRADHLPSNRDTGIRQTLSHLGDTPSTLYVALLEIDDGLETLDWIDTTTLALN